MNKNYTFDDFIVCLMAIRALYKDWEDLWVKDIDINNIASKREIAELNRVKKRLDQYMSKFAFMLLENIHHPLPETAHLCQQYANITGSSPVNLNYFKNKEYERTLHNFVSIAATNIPKFNLYIRDE